MNIENIKQDISSLEYEIEELRRRKVDVQKQIDNIDKRQSMLESINALKALIREKSPAVEEEVNTLSDNKRRKINNNQDSGYFPAVPIQHEFFDSSISKYFKETASLKRKNTDPNNQGVDISEKLNNILLENIYRMFGITLFPLMDPDKKVKELMGVRIEIFDQFKGIFEQPYYLILQKKKNKKWIIFKKTIPIYIEEILEKKNDISDEELIPILKQLKEFLMNFTYKKQFFQHLESIMENCFIIEKKDYKFEDVIIKIITESKKELRVRLKLDNTKVLISTILNDSNFTNEEILKISYLLKINFKKFEEKIKFIRSNY